MKYTLAAAALLGATQAAEAAPAPAGCAIKVAFFTDKECKTADKEGDATVKKTWEDMAKAVAPCTKVKDSDPATYSMTSCDGTGLTAGVYSDDKCTTLTKDGDGKDVPATTAKWGCTVMGEKSFMMTGAKTLMVATTAALALIGSQF